MLFKGMIRACPHIHFLRFGCSPGEKDKTSPQWGCGGAGTRKTNVLMGCKHFLLLPISGDSKLYFCGHKKRFAKLAWGVSQLPKMNF